MTGSTQTVRECERFGAELVWYLNGTLEPAAQQEVRAHLASCGSCAREAALQRAVADHVRRAASSVHPSPRGSLERMMQRVEAWENRRGLARWRELPRTVFARPQRAMRAAAVLLVLAGGLAVLLHPPPAQFETLGQTAPLLPGGEPVLRLVLAEGVTEAEAARLLAQLGGGAIAVPAGFGVYLVRLPDGAGGEVGLQRLAATLRERPEVALAGVLGAESGQ